MYDSLTWVEIKVEQNAEESTLTDKCVPSTVVDSLTLSAHAHEG